MMMRSSNIPVSGVESIISKIIFEKVRDGVDRQSGIGDSVNIGLASRQTLEANWLPVGYVSLH
jgi:hypothetical protein